MNTKIKFGFFILISMLACMVISCTSDEDEPITPPTEDNTGDVSVTIDTGGSSGSGSSSSPIVVEKGKTLNMVLSQKSSYTDPDGSVITREPKANISLKAKLDTLYVKDIKTLTSVDDKPQVESASSGNSPLRNQTLQTFNIGGQEVVFDLGYEIYKIVNSANKTIEMPYIKLNPAQYGTANSVKKTEDETRAAVYMTGITLTPLNQTRGVTVTDSAAYNVSVSFNLDIESVNTKTENKQNLSFTVDYIGIVETSTEYPDPTTTFSYDLNILGGTKNKVSPFTLIKGKTLHLEWKQAIKHTYFSLSDLAMKNFTFEPNAFIKLSAESDTIWAETAADFEKVTAGEPVVSTTIGEIEQNASNQVFDIGGQKISAEWIYEICRGKIPGGEEVALPYLELGTLNLVSVSAVKKGEAEDVEEIGDKTAAIYEITAKFSQDLISRQTNKESKQTLEYIVKYIGAIEITLAKIEYRKGYQWYPAHDNIPLACQLIVYRDRTYSNGVTFTDVFQDYLRGIDWLIYSMPCEGSYLEDHEEDILGQMIVFYHANISKFSDYGEICSAKTRVPDLNVVSDINIMRDEYHEGGPGEDLTKYWYANDDGFFDPAHPKEHSWCIRSIQRIRSIEYLTKPDEAGIYICIKACYMGIQYRDRFFYIDGKIIDFLDEQMKFDFDFRDTRGTTSEGYPARILTNECKAKYLGKDFYWTVIDTLYQTTPLQ